MVLLDRMVLLLIDMAPEQCVTEANLQLVLSRLNKRYNLQFENGLEKFNRSLRSLNFVYIERGPDGLKLGDGGLAEVERMHRKQAPFCSKLKDVADSLFQIQTPLRSAA